MSQTTMSQQQTRSANALDKVDPVWARIRREAEAVVRQEPELASFVYSSVLHHDRLEDVVVHRIARTQWSKTPAEGCQSSIARPTMEFTRTG